MTLGAAIIGAAVDFYALVLRRWQRRFRRDRARRGPLLRPVSALFLATSLPASAGGAQALTVDAAKKIALDAHVDGYSLITAEVTRVQTTNVDTVEEIRAPMGRFANVKRYPPADYRGVSAEPV